MKSKKKVKVEPKKRTHKFHHKDRFTDIAQQIERERPSWMIIYNTLTQVVFQAGYADGYEDCTADRAYFKEKKEVRRKASWDSALTLIDDIIHESKQ